MIPGIDGQASRLSGAYQGLRDAGIDGYIEIIPWGTSRWQALQNLMDLPANKKRAEKIATRLIELRQEHPDQLLTLIGFSGGGGLAILSVEDLPDDVLLDRIILVAAAISNDYDLSKVLGHCKDRLINFYSGQDLIVGLGTELFGTIDRKKTISAGHSGFLDADGRLRRSEKLVQIPWTPAWTQYGHHGGHIGYLSRSWARHVLAPQVGPLLEMTHYSN